MIDVRNRVSLVASVFVATMMLQCGSDETKDGGGSSEDAGAEAAGGAVGASGAAGRAGAAGAPEDGGVPDAAGDAGGAAGTSPDASPDTGLDAPADVFDAGADVAPDAALDVGLDSAPDGADAADEDAPALPGHPIYCGAPPHGTMSIEVVDLTTDTAQVQDCDPIPGASVEVDLCPGLVATTYVQGLATLGVTYDSPFYLRVTHPEYVPTLTQELRIDGPDGGVAGLGWLWMVPPAIKPDTLSPWQDGEPAIAVVIRPKQGFTCTQEGVTVSVEGHPEATVTYIDNSQPAPGATATSDDGYALITGLPSSGYVTPVATAPGCSYDAACDKYGEHATGRAPLMPDWLTQVQMCPTQ